MVAVYICKRSDKITKIKIQSRLFYFSYYQLHMFDSESYYQRASELLSSAPKL